METYSGPGSEQRSKLKIAAGGASDKGPTRSENQDAFWIPDQKSKGYEYLLFLVADGVGGQESGADAAQLAVKSTREIFSHEQSAGRSVREALQRALQKANQAVFEEAQRREVRRMGATFVAAVVQDGQLTIAHVGDARAYLVREGEMRRLTRDDTWVQRQLEEGLITEEQAANHEYRNVVTQVLGNKPQVNVHLSKVHTLQAGDAVLLCSDGLYDVLSNNDMLPIITSLSAGDAAQKLIDDAIEGKATDNITAVVVKISGKQDVLTPPVAELTPEDQPTMLLTEADQPTTSLNVAEQPTMPASSRPSPPQTKKEKGGVPKWLIILTVAAVILIIAALFFYWMQNRDLESMIETAAGADMTAVIEDIADPTTVSSALRPAADNNEVAVEASPFPATEAPPPTPTPLPSPTLEATAEPRGCVNDEVIGYVWDRLQVETGNCVNTPNSLDVGQEVIILEETIITGEENCNGVQFIRVQSVSDPDLEGWIAQGAVDRSQPGESCSQ